jgi:2-dehydropantoate 2-reductase
MKISILGCGAIGSLYAARLAQNPENEVICIVRSAAHASQINTDGINITDSSGKSILHASPRALTDTSEETAADLVLVAVKSHTTLTAVQEHKNLFGPKTIALTLQNGYGNHLDLLNAAKPEQILMGTTAMGVNINTDGKIILAGNGKTVMGALSEKGTAALKTAESLLVSAGFEVETTDDVQDAILRKLLVNVGINAVCTLNNLENRFICENAEMRERSRQLVYEAVDIINQAEKRSYDSAAIWENVLAVAEKTGKNVCSMLQDARNGRQTEIEKINGAVVKMANSIGLTAPANQKVVDEILNMK